MSRTYVGVSASVYVSAYVCIYLAYMCTRACVHCVFVRLYMSAMCLVHVGVSASVYVSAHVCVDVCV